MNTRLIIFASTIAMLFVVAANLGCKSNNNTPGSSAGQTTPPPPTPPEEDQDSFAVSTKNYNMLGVQESKEWLLQNTDKVTITDIGNNTLLIQGNLKITVSRGSGFTVNMEGTVLAEDDEGNIRVGFDGN